LVVADINTFLNYTSFLTILQLTDMALSGEHLCAADNMSMRGVFQWSTSIISCDVRAGLLGIHDSWMHISATNVCL